MSYCSIKSFNIGILSWFTWLNIEHRNLMFFSPTDELTRKVFRAMVPIEYRSLTNKAVKNVSHFLLLVMTNQQVEKQQWLTSCTIVQMTH